MNIMDLILDILRNGSAGFFVGVLIGLTGIGGGAVIQPVLIFILGLSPVASVGTGLLFSMIAKIGGAVAHIRLRNIRPRRVLFFLCGSVPSVLIVPWIVNRFVSYCGVDMINRYLQNGMAVVMLVTAVLMVLQYLFMAESLQENRRIYHKGGPFPLRKKLLALASGGIIGAIIGATSIGGGVLIIPVFMLWLDAGIAEAVGSSIVIALLLSGLGGFVYLIEGNIQLQTVLTLCLGAIPGVMLGSRLTGRIPERILQVLVIVLVAGSGICLLLL